MRRLLRLLMGILLAMGCACAVFAQANPVWVGLDVLREGVPASMTRIRLYGENTKKVQCALYQIPVEQFLRYLSDPRYYSGYTFTSELARYRRALPEPQGKLVQQWESTLTVQSRYRSDISYSRTVFLPKVDSGVYYLRVSAGNRWRGQFILVSSVGCVAKIGADGLLAFAYEYESGKPVGDTVITVLDSRRRTLHQARTGADGSVRIPADKLRGASALIIQRQDNVLFNYLYTERPSAEREWKIALYTDRPIYRPGQQVYYRVMVRRIAGNEYRNAPRETINLRLEDPRGRTILRRALRTGEFGTASGVYRLNSEATIGEYTLVAQKGEDESYAVFEVAAYRKPDFTVGVLPEQTIYTGKGKGAFLVKATYFFGAPVAGATVHYVVRAQPYYPWRRVVDDDEPAPVFPNLYPSDIYGFEPVLTEGELNTDSEGTARVEFDLQSTTRHDVLYTIEVTVRDAGGRSVDARGSVLGTRAAFYLDATVEPYFVTRNQRFDLHVQAQDYSGNPVATPFRAELVAVSRRASDEQSREQVLQSWQGETSTDGKGTLELSWGKEGFYVLRVTATDPAGRTTTAETYLSIWGREYRWLTMGEPPTALRLALDRSSYRPGDTARVVVLASRTPTIVWLTLETDRVLWSKQVRISDPAGVLVEIPVLPQYRPGVYVCAVALQGYYAPIAVRYLRVPYTEKRLQVDLQPDRDRYLPGDRVRYRIRTTDGQGKPVRTELSLGVVDTAIYALKRDTTPDPYTVFWGKRQHAVQTTQFLPEMVPGGAFQKAVRQSLLGDVQIRRRFEDTAYWNAHVTTDSRGEAVVEFELPDNLTRWATTARAISTETHAGMGYQEFVVNKPVMVRLYLPRFAVQGDKLSFQVMLTNRTGSAQRFRLSLIAQPVGSLETTVSEERTVELQDGEQRRLDWQPFPQIPLAQRLRLTAVAVAEGIDDRRAGSDGVEHSLPVLPRATLQREVRSGTWSGQTTLSMRLPDDVLPQFGEIVLRLYNSPVARALPALSDLAYYPYGCTEQTSSTLLGIAFARQLAQRVKLVSAPWLQKAEERLSASLTRLYDLQIGEGGWAWWEDEEYPLPELTAYALVALAELRSAGVEVDASVLKTGIAAAREMLEWKSVTRRHYDWNAEQPMDREYAIRIDQRAWLVYALARHRQAPDNAIESLWRERAKLSNLGLALLGLTLDTRSAPGDDRRVEEILAQLSRRVRRDDTGAFWSTADDDWYVSSEECTAFVLRLLVKRQPKHPLVAPALQWLLVQREQAWISTKAQAHLLGAIAEYVRHYPIGAGGQTVRVQIGNREPVALTVPSLESAEPFAEYRLPLLRMEEAQWQVKMESPDSAQLAYTLELRSYLPLKADGSTGRDSSSDLRIVRRFYVRKPDAQVKPGESRWEQLNRPVRVGETVMVELEVQAKGYRQYLLIEDPYPAGFEFLPWPSNRIAMHEDLGFFIANEDWCEPRDQHIALFVSGMDDRYLYIYFLRAETPGEKLALPSRVEMMYRPEVKAFGKAQSITVVDRE